MHVFTEFYLTSATSNQPLYLFFHGPWQSRANTPLCPPVLQQNNKKKIAWFNPLQRRTGNSVWRQQLLPPIPAPFFFVQNIHKVLVFRNLRHLWRHGILTNDCLLILVFLYHNPSCNFAVLASFSWTLIFCKSRRCLSQKKKSFLYFAK